MVQFFGTMARGKCQGYRVAKLLQLIAANDGKWPPMSPRNFARQFSNPEAIEQIERYAKNVAIVEETYQ